MLGIKTRTGSHQSLRVSEKGGWEGSSRQRGLGKGKLVGRQFFISGDSSQGRESSECRVQCHPVNLRSVHFRMSPSQKKKTLQLLQVKRDSTSAHPIMS